MNAVKGYLHQNRICSVFVEADAQTVKRVILVKNNMKLLNELMNASCWVGEFPMPALLGSLRRYFGGEAVEFDYTCDTSGLTTLQQKVVSIIKRIPYGHTMTYEEVAAKAGNRDLRRAVGGAAAKNPCPIIIPCHRVIGKGGSLTGFSADGGIGLKRALLQMERENRS